MQLLIFNTIRSVIFLALGSNLAVAGRIWLSSVYLSSLLFFVAGCFLTLGLLFFSKFSYIKFIVREPDFPEEWIMVLKMVKWTKNGSKTCFSWIYWKDWSWIFTEFVLFGMFLHKSHTWENFSFWDMGKVFYRESFWRNFSLTMSLEIIYGIELDN